MYRTNWTNACEIFRDLSVAQGDVPVRVEGTLGAGDKPPALNIKEETEEEFFLCSGGGAVGEAPDLGLIQEMLDMVREENLSDDETPHEAVVVITKPNPTPEPASVKPKMPKEKKQKRRNIALESFIGVDVTPKTELKLLKPEDLITKPEVSEPDLSTVESAIDKVKDWLISNEGTKANKKPAVCLQPPTNMFRKKSKAKSPIESPKENLSIKTDSNTKSPSQSQIKEFIPSAYAMEYGNKLKEKARLRENMVEDIWTRAEKQMKMMDEKRKTEVTAVEALATHNTGTATTTDTAATTDVATTTEITATTTEIAATTEIATITDIAAMTDTAAKTDAEATTGTDVTATTDTTATTNIAAILQKAPPPVMNNIGRAAPEALREKLELPGHRHLLTDDCIVCQAFTAFGYSSENM